MDERLDAYFDYIENVLGVKQIYLDTSDYEVISAKLLVLVEQLQSMTVAEKELLEKMIAAMQIDASFIKIVDESQIKNKKFNAEFVLKMLNTQQLPEVQDSQQQVTYSSMILLKQPQLKKEAWAHLQKVIAYFKK
jgi:hypothetical protein